MLGRGMRFSGVSPDGNLVEIIEIPDHPFFLGCQFHPELKSRPTRPHPLFASFIRAALAHRNAGNGKAEMRDIAPVRTADSRT